jgi:hypothetical protein
MEVTTAPTPADLLERVQLGGGLAFVAGQQHELRAAGIFEQDLAAAFRDRHAAYFTIPDDVLQSLFAAADRQRLRAAGRALPRRRSFRLYRGVAGKGDARRVHGWAWTPSLEDACWYAARGRTHHPAVVTAIVPAEQVLCYIPDRHGETFLVRPPRFDRFQIKPRRIHELATEQRTLRGENYGDWLQRLSTPTAAG